MQVKYKTGNMIIACKPKLTSELSSKIIQGFLSRLCVHCGRLVGVVHASNLNLASHSRAPSQLFLCYLSVARAHVPESPESMCYSKAAMLHCQSD